MTPFNTDISESSTTTPDASTARKSSAPSTAASLRRHAILADLNVLQVVTLMGTGLLVALGVVLGGRAYITTVSPHGFVGSQPGAHGSSTEEPATGTAADADGSSSTTA